MTPYEDDRITHYKGVKMIGSGSFGKVYIVTCDECPGKTFALKQVEWDTLDALGASKANKLKDQLVAEVDCLTSCSHEHIIGFRESFGARAVRARLFPDGDFSDTVEPCAEDLISGPICLCIVMEYAEGGDLESVITQAKNSKTKIAEERIWKWATQLICALGYLHKNKIYHRDIKPANIFLDAQDNVRVGDLGVAKQLTDDADMAQTTIGTLYFMCPEIVRNKPYDGKCDVWALGCVLHELMALRKPFMGVNQMELLDNIKYVRPADIPSKEYDWHSRELSRWMLQKDEKYRPTLLDVYSHFLRNWSKQTREHTSLIAPENVPWETKDLMEDEGKMALAETFIGMTAEEREAMPNKVKDVEFVNPFKLYAAKVRKEDMAKDNLIAKLGQRAPARQHGVAKPPPAAQAPEDAARCVPDAVGLAELAQKLERLMSPSNSGERTPQQAASERALREVIARLKAASPASSAADAELVRRITAETPAVDAPPVDDAEEDALLRFLKPGEGDVRWGALRLRREIYNAAVGLVAGGVASAGA